MPIRHRFESPVADESDADLVRPSNWNDTHAFPWRVVTAGEALVESDPVLAVITTTQDFPLPSSPSAGDIFILANARGSTAGALARVQTSGSQQIVDAPIGDDVTLEPGETIYLVARSSTLLEIV